MGFNYKPDNYIRFHQRYPNQFFFSTESASTISSRGEYFFPVVGPGFGAVNGDGAADGAARGGAVQRPAWFDSQDDTTHQMSSYDLYYPGWASFARPRVLRPGPQPGRRRRIRLDRLRLHRRTHPVGRRQRSLALLLLRHHRPRRLPEGPLLPLPGPLAARTSPWPTSCPTGTGRTASDQVTPVHVYTSGDEAELFLNGKSLGRKKKIFEDSLTTGQYERPARLSHPLGRCRL